MLSSLLWKSNKNILMKSGVGIKGTLRCLATASPRSPQNTELTPYHFRMYHGKAGVSLPPFIVQDVVCCACRTQLLPQVLLAHGHGTIESDHGHKRRRNDYVTQGLLLHTISAAYS